jgi:ubiquinone/menaquinone biosynthesis C-methylase UbiE
MSIFKLSDQLKNNYDDYYEEGNSEWRRLGAIGKADNIIALCNKLPHGSVLEVGAGEGSVLKRLSELDFGEYIYALEISASGVETINKKGIDRLVECTQYDGYNIPYEDQKFDLVILTHVVEHVEFPRKLIYEAMRVAKYVFIEVPLEDTVRLKPGFVFNTVGHINFYSPKSIRLLIQSCHLDILGEIVTNPSKDVFVYEKGTKGLFNFYVKEWLLKILPSVVTAAFTYHSSIVCQANKDAVQK